MFGLGQLAHLFMQASNASAFGDPLTGKVNFGDALQGIGNSLKAHYLGVNPASALPPVGPNPEPPAADWRTALQGLMGGQGQGQQPQGAAPQTPQQLPAPVAGLPPPPPLLSKSAAPGQGSLLDAFHALSGGGQAGPWGASVR